MMDMVHAGGQDASPHGLPANNKMLATLLANTSSPSPTVPTTIARVSSRAAGLRRGGGREGEGSGGAPELEEANEG